MTTVDVDAAAENQFLEGKAGHLFHALGSEGY